VRRTAALGLCLCLLGGVFAASALYVPGIALLLLAAASFAVTRVPAWGGGIERVAAPGRHHRVVGPWETVLEGDTVELELRVRGRLARRVGVVHRWPGDGGSRVALRGRGVTALSARVEGRGVHVLGPSTLVLADPFGIERRELASASTDLLVLPRVDPLEARSVARLVGAERAARARRDVSGSDADGLRPYRPGAPAARIHWPAVARTGTLLERRFSAEADARPLIVLDARNPATPQALDDCVRAVASLCVALAAGPAPRGGASGCAVLLPGDRRARTIDSELDGWPELHVRLALLQPGGHVARSVAERSAIVLWASAAARADVRLPTRTGALRYLVTPFPRAGRPVELTVSGCSVQPLPGSERAGGAAGRIAAARGGHGGDGLGGRAA
jgi:uncharacterized protein (DUF58 family)